jgi:multicomponent Na+:H+ antiporter subunit B
VTSLILQAATRLLQPLLLVFSILLLVQGHDEPGGGFVGGLTAAGAFALDAIANGVPSARRALRADPRTLAGVGLALSAGSATLSLGLGRPFMTGLWMAVPLPGGARLELGTPLVFDVGVYLVVLGTALTIILVLGEESR